MESMLLTLPFALLMAAQFLGAIVLISKREAIYGVSDPRSQSVRPLSRSKVPLWSRSWKQKL
jgi:hypothetical protein